MTKLFFVAFDSEDCIFSKTDVEKLKQLIDKGVCVHDGIIEADVPESVFQALPENNFAQAGKYRRINEAERDEYRREKEEFFKKHPDHDTRVYIIFERSGRCIWCPSGNNLNSFFKRNPEVFFGEAIRVPITERQYIDLYAEFEMSVDNF